VGSWYQVNRGEKWMSWGCLYICLVDTSDRTVRHEGGYYFWLGGWYYEATLVIWTGMEKVRKSTVAVRICFLATTAATTTCTRYIRISKCRQRG
jgi:hypothetical protein